MTTTTQKTFETLSLIDIAKNIQTNSKALQDATIKAGKDVIISSEKLASKFPELKNISDTALMRAFVRTEGKETEFYVNSISIYQDDNGEAQLYDAQLKPLDCEMISYSINTDLGLGQAIIEYEGIELEVSVSLDGEKLIKLPQGVIEGQGWIDSELLDLVPQPIKKLSELPLHTRITIKSISGKSRKYQSDMLSIECDGETFNNVIANAQILRGIEKYGIPCIFEIAQIKTIKNKQGKEQTNVYVNFENDVDLSDFAL